MSVLTKCRFPQDMTLFSLCRAIMDASGVMAEPYKPLHTRACVYVCTHCVQKQKLILRCMFAAMKNCGDMFIPKIRLIPRRHNAVFEDSVCMSVSMCAFWLCLVV